MTLTIYHLLFTTLTRLLSILTRILLQMLYDALLSTTCFLFVCLFIFQQINTHVHTHTYTHPRALNSGIRDFPSIFMPQPFPPTHYIQCRNHNVTVHKKKPWTEKIPLHFHLFTYTYTHSQGIDFN